MHCISVSLAGGGAGLGTLRERQQAGHMLHEAGFAHIEVHELLHDKVNYYYVMQK